MQSLVRFRRRLGLTQTQLAARAGTSQPTIAAYERGVKSPTIRTLSRIAESVGQRLVVSFVPPLTREDRRSLALHVAIADELERRPAEVIETAQRNLARLRAQHPHASHLLEQWERILAGPVSHIVESMLDPSLAGRDLRQATPFAGVLSARERAKVYAEFAAQERESP